MKLYHWVLTLAVAAPLAGPAALVGADKSDRAKQPGAFGALKAPAVESVRNQAFDWLKSVGKADAKKAEFEALWKETDRGLLDLVSATLSLGDEKAAKLLAEGRDPENAAPTKVPELLTDANQPAFYRANLALAYAKALSSRRVFEESVAVLKTVKPEQVVDPAAYFFHRAVAEHAMLLKPEANRSITGLIYDVADAPERYQMVGLLMLYDMQAWRDKDLGTVARKMDNIERRLELARGGPHTQKIQREVVARLDEIIKELENQAKGSCSGNGGGCPNGGQPGNGGGANPSSPMQDSNIANNGGPGNVDVKRLRGLAQQWGKMPEKDRAKALQDLIRDMPPRHREITENYFKKLAQGQVPTLP